MINCQTIFEIKDSEINKKIKKKKKMRFKVKIK